jgi:hypothetical protein
MPCRRASVLRAQRRYEQTPKGKAAIKRRNATTGVLADHRYRASVRGQMTNLRHDLQRKMRRTEERIAILEVALHADP